MSKPCVTLLTVAALGSCLSVALSAGEDKPGAAALAHYKFNGDAKNEVKGGPDFDLKNTQFKDNALYLNGKYEGGGTDDGYRAVGKTPKLDYMAFTVALRFKAEEFGERKTNLITGGTSYRWFGLIRSEAGNLTVTLNNQEAVHELKDAAIEKGKWTVVACGVDVPGRKIVAYLNGKKAGEIDLPKEFKFQVASSNAKDADKVWTFSNYSNGNVFHGLVDELIVYGSMLSAKELEQVPLRP